jgi:methylthioribose-1-phosphate isomerase
MGSYFTIRWVGDRVRMIDQRRLPQELVYIDCRTAESVAEAIRNMTIRGAPAIGAAAGFGMALAAMQSVAGDATRLLDDLEKAGEILKASRPTAVNLQWAVERMRARLSDPSLQTAEAIRSAAIREARAIADEDVEINRRIGLNGLSLVPDEAKILHHCNTGALATVDIGTALGVIRTAHENGKRIHVYVDETRPRLQGARLTAWELQQLGVPFSLIVDGAAAFVMKTIGIDLCLVGCDRMAANGDFANKIGTYGLAVAARAHGVPFYAACPFNSIDFSCASGEAIPIEERDPDEVTHLGGTALAPEGTRVFNPAFDVTPAEYVTAFITERGVIRPPYKENLMLVNSDGIH